MSARLSFRPRPLDLQKQFPIARDRNELDPPVEGQNDVLHLVQLRDEEAKKAKKKSEIPIPMVRALPSYERDYLPVFQEGNTYIRGRGGIGHKDEGFVEYDLEEEDKAWLDKFNGGQDRLPAQRLELLLWKLEMVNAEANDRQSAALGHGMPDRISPGIVAQIGNLRRDEALQAMSKTHALRHPTLLAIYNYWREKRVKRGKPLLRSLQAPTAASDSNPYNVFRPRDKVHRPQTRKRRENNEESLEKIRQLRQNLLRGYELLAWVTRREEFKRNVAFLDTDENHMMSLLHHEPASSRDTIEAQYSQQLKAKSPKRPLHVQQATQSDNPWGLTKEEKAWAVPGDVGVKHKKAKHRKEQVPPLQQLPSPPHSPEPEMLFARELDDAEFLDILQSITPPLTCASEDTKFVRRRARVGRGGRIIVDRCEALTGEPLCDRAPTEDAALKSLNEVDQFESVAIKEEPELQGYLTPSNVMNGVLQTS